SPPSQTASGGRASSEVMSMGRAGRRERRSVRDARGAGAQELDELRAADDGRAADQLLLVEAAFLEAGRADPDHAARLREVRDELLQRRKARLVDVVREAL